VKGEEEWTWGIMAGAASFAAVSGCMPSHMNLEGEFDRVGGW
jgi:hypothetical protein